MPSKYGYRQDRTPKGSGWLGEIKTKDKKVMTELSIGVNIDGKEMEIPAIVPTLSKDEIGHLKSGGAVTGTIAGKAVEHARQRLSKGKSPFK